MKSPIDLIFEAVQTNNLDQFTTLLSEVDPNCTKNTQPLINFIIEYSRIPMLKLLLTKKPDLYYKLKMWSPPLQYTSSYDNKIEMTKLLIQAGANIEYSNPDTYDKTPLCRAILFNSTANIELLLNSGAILTIEALTESYQKCNAIIKPYAEKYLKTVIKSGNLDHFKAIMNFVDKDYFESSSGLSILRMTIEYSQLELMKYLITLKPDLDYSNHARYTSLRACFSKPLIFIQTLLEAGANVNHIAQHHDFGLLEDAIRFEYIEIIPLLLKYGAIITIKEFDMAKKDITILHNRLLVIQLLQNHLQKITIDNILYCLIPF